MSYSDAIAIIGMAGRFPGAQSVDQLWENLCNGVEGVQRIPLSELEDTFSDAVRRSPEYVPARALLDDVDQFDAKFFRFLPKEAELADPQQRVLMECAWEALENAGYDPYRYSGNIGIYAGASINTYLLFHLSRDRRFLDDFASQYQVGSFSALIGNGHDFLASRISYKLNLRGPAVTLQSACSTSLLAVAEGCHCLRRGEADIVLAGGVSISFPQKRGYLYQEGGMVSPDGHCRPFDAGANGTVFGAGAGMVVLRRLEDALRDGDHIESVILGVGVNNDGSQKVGYSAPSVLQQAEAIAQAHVNAGVTADSISYVECHGTGTPLGDPIEVAALESAFTRTTEQKQFCAIGSIKSVVGHLDVASGVTGLIATARALREHRLPGTLHYQQPNPAIPFEDTPFYVNGATREWAHGMQPRRAGVSAFGVGGTNVHLVLEEPPVQEVRSTTQQPQLLVISAKTSAALQQSAERLADHLELNPNVHLADVAHTLAYGRAIFEKRSFAVANTVPQAVQHLRQTVKTTESSSPGNSSFALLFPGQGAQQPGMGQHLYDTFETYRAAIDECSECLQPYLGFHLRERLFSPALQTSELKSTLVAQPALFITEYALGRLWLELGLDIAFFAGHSVGEFTAATLASVFSLQDALRIVATRARLMESLPTGAMLAVRTSAAELESLLPDGCSIAADNAAMLSVAAGPFAAIEQLESKLTSNGIVAKRLVTSHAFHSPMVEPALAPLAEAMRDVQLQPPLIPILSSVTGTWLRDEEATSVDYWTRHCRETVRFRAVAEAISQQTVCGVIETGPGRTLITLARQTVPTGKGMLALASMPDPGTSTEVSTWLEAVGAVWASGSNLDLSSACSLQNTHKITLPTYPFQRERFWYSPPSNEKNSASVSMLGATVPAVQDIQQEKEIMSVCVAPSALNAVRTTRLTQEIREMLTDLSGQDFASTSDQITFLDCGFDSLFLTQFTQELKGRYGFSLAFRKLLTDINTIAKVAAELDAFLPADAPAPQPVAAVAPSPEAAPSAVAPISSTLPNAITALSAPDGSVQSLLQEQVRAMSQLFERQLTLIGLPLPAQSNAATLSATTIASQPLPAQQPVALPETTVTTDAKVVATPQGRKLLPIDLSAKPNSEITPTQKAAIDRILERYTKKTAGSKAMAQKYRTVLADPRTVSGFRSEWKEMIYSIVSARSEGSHFWDVDGNSYLDLVNGFGPIFFGHKPDFVRRAVEAQLQEGFETGPQTPLAGEVAQLVSKLTGLERVTFCNTGSEAVMAAMRLARTVTGRKKVLFFTGDYHGQFDEVLVRASNRKGVRGAAPAVPGVPQESVDNIVVLDYGSPASLEYVRQHAKELAAVMVEPVQSRHPKMQPKEFLTELRKITEDSGIAFIFDEVVTGFRLGSRGAQGYYGIRADMATYGKVAAGGMPIGILAGSRQFMDALDGGAWNFGDDSEPSVGVTFFAGTFMRHPLAMAACKAVLEEIDRQGEVLYETINRRSAWFTHELNRIFERRELGFRVEQCGSVLFIPTPAEYRYASLLYYMLRERGVFILEGFPIYITTVLTDEDLQTILNALDDSLRELQQATLLPGRIDPDAPIDVPFTPPQMEVWLATQVSDAASCAFNESFRVELTGKLRQDALVSAFHELVERHEALRLTVRESGTGMLLHPNLRISIAEKNWSGQTDDQQKSSIQTLLLLEAETPFDLTQGPLLRATVVQLAPEHHILVVTAHHIICDGWSINVLLSELTELYNARVQNQICTLPKPLSFTEYAARQQTPTAETEAYWKSLLLPAPPPLRLPLDQLRPEEHLYDGDTYETIFSRETLQALKDVSRKNGCTLFTTLLGGFQLFIARLSQQQDLAVLIPAAAQSQLEDEILVGHCVHLLPIRAQMDPNQSAAGFLKKLQTTVLDAYDHQDITYGTLVHTLNLKRGTEWLPLTSVQFNLEKLASGAKFHDLQSVVSSNPKRAVNFDLFLNITEHADGLTLSLDYNRALLHSTTVAYWMEQYAEILQSLVLSLETPLESLLHTSTVSEASSTLSGPIVSWEETHVLALVERQMLEKPDALAIRDTNTSWTYGELRSQVAIIAAALQEAGVQPGDFVGIMLERSPRILAAFLAVWKLGAAYIPLDPIYPAARIQSMLEDSQPKLVLTEDSLITSLPTTQTPFLSWEQLRTSKNAHPVYKTPSSNDLAYVLYTSGSTGKPKGVKIPHSALSNLLLSVQQTVGFVPSDSLFAITTICFDIAQLEFLLPIISGGSVYVATVGTGSHLKTQFVNSKSNVMQATPVVWKMLLREGFESRPDMKMLCGGEAWTADLAVQLLNGGGRLWNAYGPTETTVWSALQPITPEKPDVCIGGLVANTNFLVVDEAMHPVPIGTAGELLIGGTGVAAGYLHRPELTRERFVQDPTRADLTFSYRTGDSVRQMPDGTYAFLGRLDQQIKLNGYRIELGEIEATLSRELQLTDVAVVVRNDQANEPRLVAYFSAPGDYQLSESLIDRLSDTLPIYMIPQHFEHLVALPRTENQKIDRRSLPEPRWDTRVDTEPAEGSLVSEEKKLAEICLQVLNIPSISRNDNILRLGADSLRIFQIAARAYEAGIPVTARLLMKHKTIAAALAATPGKADIAAPLPSSNKVVRLNREALLVKVD